MKYSILLSTYISIALLFMNSFVMGQSDKKNEPTASDEKPPAALLEIEVPQPTAKVGEFVLCPSRQFYDNAVEKGITKTTFIYYAAKMTEPGETESTVTNLAGRKFSIPNSMIISVPPAQECKKGDVLLTWWQSGSGMQRAYVVGGSATQPVVRYLDIVLKSILRQDVSG